MSRLRETSETVQEVESRFTQLAQAIGNTDYSAEQFNGRMKSFAKVMAITNKIGYATLPFYFRLKNQVETSLLAFGKLSDVMKKGGKDAGLFGKAFGALGKQFGKAKDVFSGEFTGTGETGFAAIMGGEGVRKIRVKDRAAKAANFLSFGATGQISKLVKLAKTDNKRQKIRMKIFRLQEKYHLMVGRIMTKIKNVPLKAIFTKLGTFLLFGLKAFIILSIGLTLLIILFKSKAVQNTVKRIVDILIEVAKIIFSGIKDIFEGFILIYRALTSDEGIVKSLKMALRGIGKIFLGIAKLLFGSAFVILKGLFKVVLGAIYDVGVYIVEKLKSVGEKAKQAGGAVFRMSSVGRFIAPLLGFARGGIAPGGPVLVGEMGPELVRLPMGSRVFSNKQSAKMMSGSTTNITVNVQGRIGASDTELRQIASKIGSMINKEVNRTTSSRGTIG